MNERDIHAAKARAEAVINGFQTPKMQQARDVLKLVEVLEVRNRQVNSLAEQLWKATVNNRDPFPGIF
jgi:hypothetical protein